MNQQAVLDILPDHVDGTRDIMIFGHFLEHFHRQIYGGVYDPGSHLADENGFRRDVIEALRQIKTPVIRWPGGCFVSAYPWKKGVGERAPYYDKAWRVEEPNTFGTDEFVRLCREVGAAPFICTNAGTGTPEDMSDWVEYCNLDIGEWAGAAPGERTCRALRRALLEHRQRELRPLGDGGEDGGRMGAAGFGIGQDDEARRSQDRARHRLDPRFGLEREGFARSGPPAGLDLDPRLLVNRQR